MRALRVYLPSRRLPPPSDLQQALPFFVFSLIDLAPRKAFLEKVESCAMPHHSAAHHEGHHHDEKNGEKDHHQRPDLPMRPTVHMPGARPIALRRLRRSQRLRLLRNCPERVAEHEKGEDWKC